ncbi:unnamed protein product, partial [Candidula unifasciata]
KVKENKKLDKKRRAEERRREKILGGNQQNPQTTDTRDVMVVSCHAGKLTRI